MKIRIVATALFLAVNLVGSGPVLALDTGQCLPMAAINAAMKAEGQRSLFVADRADYDGQPVSFAGTTMTRAAWMRIARDIQFDSPYRRDLIVSLKAKGRTSAQIDTFIAKLRDISPILAKGDPDAPIPQYMMAFASNREGSSGYVIEGDHPLAEVSSRACIRAKLTNLRLAGSAALDADGRTATDLLTAQGDVLQLNGVKASRVSIALRGSVGTGEAQVVALQPGNPPLYILVGVKVHPAAEEFVGR